MLINLLIFATKILVLLRMGDKGWEPDEYMHFAQLRAVFSDFPANLSIGLEVWAKPLYTYPLGFLVQVLGTDSMFAVRVANILIVMLIGLLAYKSLRKLNFSQVASLTALLIVNFSFLLFRSSLTALTEPIFGLTLIGSYYLLLTKRYNLAALVIGLSLLGRIEGALFILIWICFFCAQQVSRKQKVLFIGLATLPGIIWNLLGFLVSGRILYIVQSGYPSERGVYGFGSWVHYFYGLLVQEPLLLVLIVLSVGSLLGLLWRRQFLAALPAISFGLFFLAQVVFWRLGMFGTAGLMRYFIGVMPFLVIAAFQSWKLIEQQPKYQIWLTSGLIVLLQLFISFSLFAKGGYFHSQLAWPQEHPAVIAAGEWLQKNLGTQKLYVDLPALIYYARHDSASAKTNLGEAWRQQLPGVYVWSKEWGESVHQVSLAEVKQAKVLAEFEDFIYIFELN